MRVFCVLGLVLSLHSVAAAGEVPPLYETVALEHKVPAKLFYALILNESRSVTKPVEGRVGGTVRPWPWTVNYQGEGHFFATREDAFTYANSLVNRGIKHFDVGLGQINWHWHHKRFGNNLWEAFDPTANLSVAAKLLREQFERPECNAWEKAIGCYHRPAQRLQDRAIAQHYALRVIDLWTRL